MHDCCIRVTSLLECLEWTLNKLLRGMASTMLSMPSGWGSTLGAISFYCDLIFMGCVSLALDQYWYQKGRGHCAYSYKTNE